MEVFIEKENKTLSLDFKGTVKQLLEKLNINLETVVVLKDDEIITEEEVLEGNENIKILSVISGG